jgi:protein-L-isoaspartate(D-aspartate) O-methyltransferase
VTDRCAEQCRHAMVAKMIDNGQLISPGWRAAFEQVPRHSFVPAFYRQTPTGQRLVNHLVSSDEWLTGVYEDRALVISPDGRSSSTAPSLMAAMLEALEPADGHHVLEIGTGTGYNAALLCQHLGDQHLTTLDIDPELVEQARVRLADVGYRPTVVTGDGAAGWARNAPYDRLIATCAVDAIPQPWLTQLRSGGRIVTPIATGVAVLTNAGAGVATGRFLPEAAYFMPLRPDTVPADVSSIRRVVVDSTASGRSTDLGPDIWFDSGLRFLLAVAVPGLRYLTQDPVIFSHPDGSWARLSDGHVTQGGPRNLWDAVEESHRCWNELDHPGRENFTLTVTNTEQRIHLPATSRTWTLDRGDDRARPSGNGPIG